MNSERRPTSLGRRLRDLRLSRNLSQRDLAAASGASPSWIGQVERGTIPAPGGAKLACVAAALRTSVDAILSGDATGWLPPDGGTLPAGDGAVADGGDVVAAAPRRLARGSASGRFSPTPAHRLVPVYRYGTVGDPEDEGDAPDPAAFVPLPEVLVRGERSRVGTRGWGVVLNGDELSRHATAGGGRLRAGWAVFCNPAVVDGPPEAWEGRLVVALSLARELVAGVLERAPEGATIGPLPEWVVRTDALGVPRDRERRTRLRRVYGPAVYYQPPGFEAASPVDDGAAGSEPVGPHFLAGVAERRAG